jgi:hypothetical protein
MATTNAAIKQMQTGVKNLNVMATAQNEIKSGNNINRNMARANNAGQKAASNLRSSANKFDQVGLSQVATSLRNAANAAETGEAAVRAAKFASSAIVTANKAINSNINKINQGKPLTNGAGLV